MVRNIVIVGSGAAGYTAAIYSSRANLKPILYAGPQLGGQLTITSEVENFPGFPEGILGPELMARFEQQARKFGTEIVMEQISQVNFKVSPFVLTESSGKTVQARTVIVSTGASAQILGLPSEKRLFGHGVSACATCDGFFFKGKDVVVVGGGDTAMEDANFLTKFAQHVTIIHRRDQFRASKFMLERSRNNPKISFNLNSVVEDILGDKTIQGLRIKDTKTMETKEILCGGLFVAIGHKPNTEFLRGQLELNKKGYVVTKGGSKTSVSGIFAAGDCADHVYRQAVTAAGTGCMAALEAEDYLEGQ